MTFIAGSGGSRETGGERAAEVLLQIQRLLEGKAEWLHSG